jgi:hypothetical protein
LIASDGQDFDIILFKLFSFIACLITYTIVENNEYQIWKRDRLREIQDFERNRESF